MVHINRRRALQWIGLVAVVMAAVAACDGEPLGPEEKEVREAVQRVFPEMEDFALVTLEDAPIVARLEEAISSGAPGPVHVDLPILNEAGRVAMKTWTAYHVNLRNIQQGSEEPDSNTVTSPDLDFSGPSKTFQGVPNWQDGEFLEEIARLEANRPDLEEATMQPSVLNIIGSHLEGAYYGSPDGPSVSVFESLENLLQPALGSDEAQRLATLSDKNYIVYLQEDFQPAVRHGEVEYPLPEPLASDDVTVQLHTAVKRVRPVMVADSTIYDPDTGTWLVDNWFARVDAAANRQNAYLWLVNIGPDIPAGSSTLTSDNNRVFVRTEIGGYLVLTRFGKTLISFPTQSCGGSGTFVDIVRGLSNSYVNHLNEYWMWWTKQYGGGCAYVSTLGRTPRDGAVGWSGFGSGTVDWTSFVFMHESGHILGGTHITDAPGSPETFDSHRCRLFGFWAIGPTGPSLMSYASGTRTYCFAVTPSSGTPKKNLTKVAEYLHTHLQ